MFLLILKASTSVIEEGLDGAWILGGKILEKWDRSRGGRRE